MRAACCLATTVFAGFAALQWNDLEQYGTRLWLAWMLLYGAVALGSAFAAWRPLPRALSAGGAVLALLAAGVRATAVDGQGALFFDPANPAANETGGLLVVAGWLAVLAWKRPATARNG